MGDWAELFTRQVAKKLKIKGALTSDYWCEINRRLSVLTVSIHQLGFQT